MAGGIEVLPAPAWLGEAGLTRCRRALGGKLARETWKYSPLDKTAQALLEAPRTERPPFADAPEQVRVRRFSALPSPPECRINLHRYPLAGIVGALAGDGWLAEVAETPDRPLRLPAAAPGVAAPLLLRVAAGCRVEIEEAGALVEPQTSNPTAFGHSTGQTGGAQPANGAPGTKPVLPQTPASEAESTGSMQQMGNEAVAAQERRRTAAAKVPQPSAQPGSLAARVVLLSVGRNAEVHWSRADLEPTAAGWSLLVAELDDDAALTFNHQSLAGAFQRLDLCVALHGAGASFSSRGAALAGAGAHLDLQYVVEHIGRHTVSRVQQHSLAAGKARCTFNGRIHIHPHAGGTDADLSNRNLALNTNAEINTKPELEIYNDDVRCAHGATVGQLDDDALFYLQSRGMAAAAARRLLSIGFLRSSLQGPFAERAADAFTSQMAAAGSLLPSAGNP